MTEDLLVFDIAEQHYGLPVAQVREVLPRASLTSLAGCPPSLAGLLRLRGALLPVVDLRQRLGFAAASPHISQCIVVVRRNGPDVGLLVDAARGLVSSESAACTGAEHPAGGRIFRRVAVASDEVVAVLDTRAAIGPEVEGFLPAVLTGNAEEPGGAAELRNRPEQDE